jgi:glucose-6-phosphate isomerase
MSGRPDADTAPIPEDLAALAGAPYLAGRTVGDLVLAQTRAIADAFTAHNRPVRIIELSHLDEYALGWLMMHYMLETILAADLLGVDPFDQPAVELGKRLTKDYLARMAVVVTSTVLPTGGTSPVSGSGCRPSDSATS